MSVGVQFCTCTYYLADGVAQRIFHRKYHNYSAVAIVYRRIMLRVDTRKDIRAVADGVSAAGTNFWPYGVPEGVIYHQENHQVMVAPRCRVAEILCVNPLAVIRRIVVPAYRHITVMSVGVECLSRTDYRINRIPQGVVHRKKYHQIMETSRGSIPKVLCINALIIIRRIVLSVHRKVTLMTIGVEGCSRTDCIINGIAKSIKDMQNQRQRTVTTINGGKRVGKDGISCP